MLEALKEEVCEGNLELPRHGLVTWTSGNLSARDPQTGLVVIKPSGLRYERMTPEDMVVVDLDGNVVEGTMNPSSDTQTHRVLYREFSGINAIVHTHSSWAVSFAQAGVEIEAMGTTHADNFYGTIPVTEALTQAEIESAYEENTGQVIVRTFRSRGIDPAAVPAVLVKQHGPFTWGATTKKAVENAKVLDLVAEMNYRTMTLQRGNTRVPQYLLDKHYLRKHGANAYYGQNA